MCGCGCESVCVRERETVESKRKRERARDREREREREVVRIERRMGGWWGRLHHVRRPKGVDASEGARGKEREKCRDLKRGGGVRANTL